MIVSNMMHFKFTMTVWSRS